MDLIIGAGVTGLSYAAFTENDYMVCDADSEIGGYCKTIKRNGFVWDYSGHFFHFRNEDIKDWLLKDLHGDVLDVNKKTHILYENRLIDFPFQKNIHQLNKDDFIDCIYDLVNKEDNEVKSFKDFIYSRFGKKISELFLIPYNEKLYATDLNELDKDAMGRFFPDCNFNEIVSNFKKSKSSSYNDYFTYPKGGAIQYVKSIAKKVDSSKIRLNCRLEKIDMNSKIATFSDGESYQYENLISTAPFPVLLDACSVDYKKEVFSANKVLVFNLGFDKKSLFDSHWIYFPQKDIKFYRIGFYDNIFDDDRMSLYVEIGMSEDESYDKDILLKEVIEDLKKVGIITSHKLIDYESILMSPAYVHISGDSESHKNKLLNKLRSNSIYSIGRYGSWTYCSIEDNIIEARSLCEHVNNNNISL